MYMQDMNYTSSVYRYERPHADYIDKLPKGKHSCKGMTLTLTWNLYNLLCLYVFCMSFYASTDWFTTVTCLGDKISPST